MREKYAHRPPKFEEVCRVVGMKTRRSVLIFFRFVAISWVLAVVFAFGLCTCYASMCALGIYNRKYVGDLWLLGSVCPFLSFLSSSGQFLSLGLFSLLFDTCIVCLLLLRAL